MTGNLVNTEVIVIGGGIAGCSAAYYLAKLGHQVTLLEKNPAVGLEASGRNACGVRQQGRKAALPLAMASVRTIWRTFAEELGSDLEYRQTGNLKVQVTEDNVELLQQEVAWEQAQGLTEVHMISAAECRELIPGLSERVLAGKFCPTDGIANPMLVTPAIARAAKRLGASILTHTEVTGLQVRGSRVFGVTTTNGDIAADIVINAAGPWSSKFNEMVGCRTPIQPGMSQLMITERQPHRITPWTGGYAYTLQTKSGNIVLGINGVPNNAYRKGVNYPDIVQKAALMISLIPWLSDVNLIRSFSGITEYTPDEEPYIGSIPGIDGYYTLCGFHGQGFCVGPMAAKVIAEIVSGREPSVFLSPFKPDRFSVITSFEGTSDHGH